MPGIVVLKSKNMTTVLPSCQVTPIDQADLNVILRMWSELTRDLHRHDTQPFGEPTPQRFEMLEQILKNSFANEKAEIFKACDANGQCLGTISVVLNIQQGFSRPDSGVIFNLWVDPEQRRNGIGSLLVAKTKLWLKGQGISSVQAGWNPNNKSADRFWTQQGFCAFELLASAPL